MKMLESLKFKIKSKLRGFLGVSQLENEFYNDRDHHYKMINDFIENIKSQNQRVNALCGDFEKSRTGLVDIGRDETVIIVASKINGGYISITPVSMHMKELRDWEKNCVSTLPSQLNHSGFKVEEAPYRGHKF